MNILIDFDDSFTFNLRQFLENMALKVKIVHWTDFISLDLGNVKQSLLKPGPGHPLRLR